MSARPTDWSPLTGGDPSPGDSDAWQVAITHWETRVKEADSLRQKLVRHLSIDGDGNQIRGTEVAFAEGVTLVSLLMEQFEQARLGAQEWRDTLSGLQGRADAILARAQEAQERKEEAVAKIAFLTSEAAEDASPDPLISLMLVGWEEGLAEAQQTIAICQGEIDQIRSEYDRAVWKAIAGYSLDSIAQIYEARAQSNPFARPASVVSTLGLVETAYLDELARRAGSSTEDMRKYLETLGELSTGELEKFFEDRPEWARYPLPVPDGSVETAELAKEWWAGLSKEQRAALIEAAPGFVGNLNGVSYDARDRANRRLLEIVENDPATDPATLAALGKLREAAVTRPGEPDRYITGLDLTNIKPENEDGYGYNNVLASVSLGSVDEADRVSVLVPGMTNNVEDMGDLAKAGLNIYREQENALAVHNDSAQKLAVVLWIGYESPPEVKDQASPQQIENRRLVTDIALAETGGQKLAHFVDGMNVTRSQTSTHNPVNLPDGGYSQPFVSIIAHSYGTTVTAEAMQEAETTVDSLVFYGSAGLGIGAILAANSSEGWKVNRDAQGRQQIFFTDSLEDWTAPGGYLPGWAAAVAGAPWVSQENRLTPHFLGDAQRFDSSEAVTAEGLYLGDVDTHSLDSKGDEEGFVHENTTSLTYGSRAALGYAEDLEKKLYEPWYWVVDVRGEPAMIRITEKDLVDGRVPEELMRKVKESQSIPENELLETGVEGVAIQNEK